MRRCDAIKYAEFPQLREFRVATGRDCCATPATLEEEGAAGHGRRGAPTGKPGSVPMSSK
jgi:hypothetical protein